jgi:peptidyl-prolyl cis-trans isomerase C
MRLTAAAFALGAALVALAAPARAAEKMVATVNGVGITQAEFDRNWKYFLQKSGIPSTHADKTGKVDEFRKQVMDTLVDKELLVQEAASRKVVASPERVEAEMAGARKQFATDKEFRDALAKNTLTEESLRVLYGRELTIQALIEQVIAQGVTVSDADVTAFYASNKDKFETPEQVRARHILVKVDEKADAKAREAARGKAADLLAQVKGGADFAELAKKSSDCPSAPQGGDLGFFQHGQMVEPFDKAAFALKPGEVSGVVETQFGYHVIKLEERREAGLVSEAEAAPRIREYLKGQKVEEAVEARLKELRQKAKIVLVSQQ